MELIRKIDKLMESYNMCDNILRFNVCCRFHGMLEKVFFSLKETKVDTIDFFALIRSETFY